MTPSRFNVVLSAFVLFCFAVVQFCIAYNYAVVGSLNLWMCAFTASVYVLSVLLFVWTAILQTSMSRPRMMYGCIILWCISNILHIYNFVSFKGAANLQEFNVFVANASHGASKIGNFLGLEMVAMNIETATLESLVFEFGVSLFFLTIVMYANLHTRKRITSKR